MIGILLLSKHQYSYAYLKLLPMILLTQLIQQAQLKL
ncbi:hypothetical protein Cycma_2191 [Cyclobacterium marinum DSM 745]|uniref:Uncharacterized protein n=1 Tax=Cyclobacterium marinum (strain ATCC 25205 / DSM 745 / LMG 13164 / NCIMB 1802) TaxID=880070 RepID=G0J3W2_CYCMS|nr:hypothetical protein Cycma_2191 [Cyclobacterium marinum DSM 745]